MPTAKGGYFLKSGERVPSVTTILSRFKESGGLVHWAWQLGKEGKDYREERDKAADAGTMAHAAVDAYIHQQPYIWDGDDLVVARAKKSYQAFLEWADQTQLKATHTELPLVSERYRFGGTFDAILIKGRRSCGDWKTSNKLYPENLLQVAAYKILWEENFPDQPIDGGCHILRFDKEHGDFEHRYFGEVADAEQTFLQARELYEAMQRISKRVK
jgi:hypothetical protein